MIPLLLRRPDLQDLLLDEETANRIVAQIDIVNSVLERSIKEDAEKRKLAFTSVEDKLLSVRYPIKQFPYENYWQQLKTVLTHNQLSFSDVTRLSDTDAPYFTQPKAHSPWSDTALQQDSGLGPALRAILLESPYFSPGAVIRFNPQTRQLLTTRQITDNRTSLRTAEDDRDFFRDNFGAPDFGYLQNVVNFRQTLHMDEREMESLFCLGEFAPTRSPNAPQLEDGDDGAEKAAMTWIKAGINVKEGAVAVSPAQFGAVFINQGTEAAVSVNIASGSGGIVDDEQLHVFKNLTEQRCDRINRLVRLAQALELSYSETDNLLTAAIAAEQRAVVGAKQRNADGQQWITPNTLRALGLFQFLRHHFSCQAEECAALLSEISIHGIGNQRSQFDRIFNDEKTVATSLVLDGEAFNVGGIDADSERTVAQLCEGLKISLDTFRYIARTVMQAQGDDRLRRTAVTVSGFYRIVLLARLLGITTTELLSLLEVMNPGGQFALELAGRPHNIMYQQYEQADVVSVIYAVSSCVLWCRQQKNAGQQKDSVFWLVQQLVPMEAKEKVSEEEKQPFSLLRNSVLPTCFTDSRLLQANVVPLPETQSWQDRLHTLIDDDGLLLDDSDIEQDLNSEGYRQFAAREIERVIAELVAEEILPDYSSDERDRLREQILSVVLSVRILQWGVLQEQFSSLLELDSQLVVPVVYWAGGSVHQLLQQAMHVDDEASLIAIMPLVNRMKRYAGIVQTFSLSSKMLSAFLPRRQQRWFSMKTTEVTLNTLYLLSQYAQILKDRPKEDQLLGYLALIDGLRPPEEMSENERLLIKDAAAEKLAAWLGWGVREVLDVARQVSSDGIIRELTQILVLAESKRLADKTGLSSASLMGISRLNPHDDTLTYRRVAEETLSSLNRVQTQQRSYDDGELRQSITTKCQVNKTRLVAQREGEVATATIRILNMDNQPVPGIEVTWSTDVGMLLDAKSVTDAQGYASARLQAGKRMGAAHVEARYLLGEKAYAPPIIIDCDEETLGLSLESTNPTEPWQLAGEKGEYCFSVVLEDAVNDVDFNYGVDRPVRWATSIGRFVDSTGETLTDMNGRSEVRLRSYSPGSGEVAVWYALDPTSSVIYIPVTFVNQPRVTTLQLISSAIVGDDIRVQARILGVDDQPIAGVTLNWTATGATVTNEDVSSDVDGNAFATLSATTAGTASVTVTINDGEGAAEGQSQTLNITVLDDVKMTLPVQDQKYPLADGVQYSEYQLTLSSNVTDGEPVADYPVEWSVMGSGAEPVVVKSNRQGVVVYQFRTEVPGEYTIQARVAKGNQTHAFDPITAYPPLALEVLLNEKPVSGGGIVLTQGETYRLTFRIAAGHPLLTDTTQLLFSGRESASGLELGFTPALGLDNSFTGREVSWQIDCGDTSIINQATFQLGLTYQHAVLPYWIEGVLRPKN